MTMTTEPGIRDALIRCAGCHDQCMSATPEALADGAQTHVVSRVATLGLLLSDGHVAWDAELAKELFYGLNDGLQAEVCIYRHLGHRIEPYLRQLRAEAVARGLAPVAVEEAAASIRRTGNVFGVDVPVMPAVAPGSTVIVHDAATVALSPAAIDATTRLVRRAGVEPAIVLVPSVGAVERDLGLAEASSSARSALAAVLAAAEPSLVVSSDPVVVAELRDLAPAVRALHVAELLASATTAFGDRAARAIVHDDGVMARRLDAAASVRDVLTRVAGLTVVEPLNTGRLATGDGALGIYVDGPLGMAIARRRLAELLRHEPDVILTTSPYSLATLRGVAGEHEVQDLAVFLAELGVAV